MRPFLLAMLLAFAYWPVNSQDLDTLVAGTEFSDRQYLKNRGAKVYQLHKEK